VVLGVGCEDWTELSLRSPSLTYPPYNSMPAARELEQKQGSCFGNEGALLAEKVLVSRLTRQGSNARSAAGLTADLGRVTGKRKVWEGREG